MNKRSVEAAVRKLLLTLDMDLANRDLQETPQRVAKMLMAEVKPATHEELTSILKTFDEPDDSYDSMIVLTNHRCFTRCPHHLMPVEMDVSVAYIPHEKFLGLSKLARLANFMSRGWMLQEEVAEGIVKALEGALNPLGAAVHIAARHTCMRARGVMSTHSEVVTSRVRGFFKEDQKARDEFMSIVHHNRRT